MIIILFLVLYERQSALVWYIGAQILKEVGITLRFNWARHSFHLDKCDVTIDSKENWNPSIYLLVEYPWKKWDRLNTKLLFEILEEQKVAWTDQHQTIDNIIKQLDHNQHYIPIIGNVFNQNNIFIFTEEQQEQENNQQSLLQDEHESIWFRLWRRWIRGRV